MTARYPGLILPLLLLAACGGSADAPPQDALALERTPVASLMRIAPDGGRPELYHLPDLALLDWRAEDQLAPVRRVVGTLTEPAQVVVLDAKGTLIAMRLENGRARTVVANAAVAALSADGSLYTVDTSGAAWTVGRRTPEKYRARFDGVPDRLWAGASGLLVGFDSASSVLAVFGVSDTVAVRPIESGALAVDQWADLVAVAADSAVWLYDPSSSRDPERVRAGPGATGATFSPSGHQLYVVTSRGKLAIVDRFGGKLRARLTLPGPASEVRTDPYGRWLLVRPVSGDSIWVVDLERDSLLGTVPGSWNADLPLVTSPNTLVSREGKDVVARNLSDAGLPGSGRIDNGAAALWVAVPWSPDHEDEAAAALAADTSAGAPSDSTAERIYLQVSSSQNPDWAAELVKKLGAAGLKASVLQPATPNDPYRVVLGPYPSRDAAEENGKTLGMPYFVITLPAEPN